MSPARALALRTFADARVRTVSFALMFLAIAIAITAGFSTTYPTLASRLQLARAYGNLKSARIFYGTPYQLETVGGYASWRAGGILALFAAFFGAATAVRALRGEEESGRFELVAAGAITRRATAAARLAAVSATIAALWLATVIGLVAGGLSIPGSAYLALAIVTAAAVYMSVGALTSQLAPTRRGALELAGLVLGLDFAFRVVADTAGVPDLHWASPLGWIEELRPFADPRPAVLMLPAALIALVLTISLRLERRRDVGVAVFAAHDRRDRPRLRLLASPTRFTFRSEWVSMAVWAAASAGFALVIGTTSKNVAAGLSTNLKQQLHKVGQLQIATTSGYIGLTFLFFIFAISLYCCGQLAAARTEEAEGRLETLFALSQSRSNWLTGRLLLASLGATLLALVAGLGTGIGAILVGAHVSVPRLIEAGLNCLPSSLLFLGLATLLFAAVPRHGVGAAYALVSLSFVWELFGSLLSAPAWLLGLSPFNHVGLVPGQPFRLEAAVVMIAIGISAAIAGAALFRSRDLVSA